MKKFLIVWASAVTAVILFFILSGCAAVLLPEHDTQDLILAAQRECADHKGVDHNFTSHVPGSTALEGQDSGSDRWQFSTICRDGTQINNL